MASVPGGENKGCKPDCSLGMLIGSAHILMSFLSLWEMSPSDIVACPYLTQAGENILEGGLL